MNLHTLGPIGTDSQVAATHYMTNQTLVLHDTFEEILTESVASIDWEILTFFEIMI